METAHKENKRKTKGKNNHTVMKTCTLQSKVGTHLSNLIEISLERGSDISFHKPQKAERYDRYNSNKIET